MSLISLANALKLKSLVITVILAIRIAAQERLQVPVLMHMLPLAVVAATAAAEDMQVEKATGIHRVTF